MLKWASLIAQFGKESACDAGDPSSTTGLGRSPGKGKGYPLQNSGLEEKSAEGGPAVGTKILASSLTKHVINSTWKDSAQRNPTSTTL